MGNCVAGGGYLPVLCDKLLMTEGSGLYLAGPALVKSAIGQEVSHEELGGAAMHAQISGTIDYREPDDEACLERLRRLAAAVRPDPPEPPAPFRRDAAQPPARPGTDLYDLVSPNPRRDYEVRDVLACLVDRRQLRRVQGRSTARRWSAARPASAAFPSASSPTSTTACGRPRGRSSSAACCTSTAPRRPPAS